MTHKEHILVTAALPYANGSIHLGHLVEYIQTDIWVRFHKLLGNEAYFFCADDTHGTPIMIAARNQGISPEELIEKVKKEHYHDLSSFQIDFTNYHSTNSEENRELATGIFLKLSEKGHIAKREIEQAYCEHDKIFLPDRFIKGTCPKCKAADQYGDSCEVCGSTYSSTELLEPRCSLCGTPPVRRTSLHYFVKLQDFEARLQEWYQQDQHISPAVAKKMEEWFQAGLKDWDISRDGPYFGFLIPGESDKYFYVWLDAPVGYMASALHYFRSIGKEEFFFRFWKSDPDWKIYHFIGKDIMYFHTLFWPAQLLGADYKTPNGVFVHGFLTVNGEKMSKSKGTFILASTFLRHLDSSYLRFYFAGKLSDSLDDLDLSFEDFLNRINSDLVGNLINIFSRSGGAIAKKLDYRLSALDSAGKAILEPIIAKKEAMISLLEQRQYARALREILALGNLINRYINDREPWKLVQEKPEAAREVITVALNGARILALYLKPILPELVQKIEKQLNCPPLTYANLSSFLENHTILPYEHLLQRVDQKSIDAILEESKQTLQEKTAQTTPKGDSSLISLQELQRSELRVGEIVEAKEVAGADKLLQLTINLGELGNRNVFAGIRIAYQASALIGKKCVVVSNLEPRKMRFGVSEAMILATGEGESLSLVIPDRQAKNGDRLK